MSHKRCRSLLCLLLLYFSFIITLANNDSNRFPFFCLYLLFIYLNGNGSIINFWAPSFDFTRVSSNLMSLRRLCVKKSNNKHKMRTILMSWTFLKYPGFFCLIWLWGNNFSRIFPWFCVIFPYSGQMFNPFHMKSL